MPESTRTPQALPVVEPKNETIAVRCTASEKRAVRFLSLATDATESDLLRDMTMAAIVADADRRRALMEPS
jgi:hypothetical protein